MGLGLASLPALTAASPSSSKSTGRPFQCCRTDRPLSGFAALLDIERKYWSSVRLEVPSGLRNPKGAPHHGTAAAPELVHPRPRASRSIVASFVLVATALDRYPLLPGSGTAGRGRTVRFNLPC